MKKVLILISLFWLFSCPYFAQNPTNYVYSSFVLNYQGKPASGATVTVCSFSATLPPVGTVCSATVSIYTSTGASQSNPFYADNYGNYSFWVPAANYIVSISGTFINTTSYYISVGGNAASGALGNGVQVIDASTESGADWSYKVNAARAACPATACVVDARGFTSPQTMSQSIDLQTTSGGPLTLLLPAQINRSSGAQFEMENYARVIGLGRASAASGNSSATYIDNESGDTAPVFANNTGTSVSWVFISDLSMRSEGSFTVKDGSGNPHTETFGTGICFDFTTQLNSSIERVNATCQISLRLAQPNFVGGAYYNFFKDDTFAATNPDGVVVQMGSFPNENNFYGTRFVTVGSAVFMNGVGGWVNFNGGDIEGAGAGIVIYEGTNIGIHDVYFEAIGPTTGAPWYAVWQANWPYVAGAVIQDSNGHTEICITAGTSGASAPSWVASAGTTTNDNTAVWLRTNNGQVVFGPTAVGNVIDGAIGPANYDNFSTWGQGASNYVFVPPSISGAGGLVPVNLTAGEFSLGTSLCGNGGACGNGNNYTIDVPSANSQQGIGVEFGGNQISEGLTGHAPVQNGGMIAAGGRSGTFLASSLNVVGLPNPGAPTVTMYGSHAGSSTVSYALTADTCGGGTYSGGTLTGAYTLPGSFTQITNAPATAGALISAAVTSGGTGYTNGGTYTVVNPWNSIEGGTSTGQVTVTASGGVISSVSISSAGNGYPDGFVGATLTGGSGSGATLTLTAYDIVIVTPPTYNYPGFQSQPFSGCEWDVIKDPTGGSSTSQSILTQQFPNMLPIGDYSSTPLLGQLLDYGQSLSSYTEPGTRNTTADSLFDGNLGIMGTFETLGTQNYFAYPGNTFFDFLHSGNQFIIGRNSPESTSGYEPFQVYNDSTHAQLIFYVCGAGSSSGNNCVKTLNNTLEDGSGDMSAAGHVNATSGYEYNGAATSGHYLRGNGSQYVDSALQSQDGTLGTVHSTGNVGAISTTTLCSASSGACNNAGEYQVNWNFVQGGTACGTPGASAGVTFLLTWTDGSGTHSAESLYMQNASSINGFSQTFSFLTSNTSAYASGTFNIWSTGANAIQYATGYTGCNVGTGTYEIDATVTRLQ